MLSEELLRLSFFLFLHSNSPNQAFLRRAVSTGYYALFHLLIESATANWRHTAARPTLARAFDHGVMKTACTNQRDSLNKTKKERPLTSPEEKLLAVTNTFVNAQEERNEADYNPTRTWQKVDVVKFIHGVVSAFRAWESIQHDAIAQGFLVTLLIKSRR